MKYDLEGKTVNIPDEDIDKLMTALDITKDEAIDLYLADNDFIDDEVKDELNAKAKAAGTLTRNQGDRKERKKAERKPDMVKREIVGFIADIFTDIAKGDTEAGFVLANVRITNNERMIAFEVGDEKFELTLTKKRKPKN